MRALTADDVVRIAREGCWDELKEYSELDSHAAQALVAHHPKDKTMFLSGILDLDSQSARILSECEGRIFFWSLNNLPLKVIGVFASKENISLPEKLKNKVERARQLEEARKDAHALLESRKDRDASSSLPDMGDDKSVLADILEIAFKICRRFASLASSQQTVWDDDPAGGIRKRTVSLPRPAIADNPFFASIATSGGVHDFLSKDRQALKYVHLGIVPWTNWLGDVYTKIKNGLSIEVANGEKIGPMVEYDIHATKIVRYAFYENPFETRKLDPPINIDTPSVEDNSFNLKSIVRTLDLEQNAQIRGPMSGVMIITGGPGTGKTTIAIHRVPYLFNEQIEYEKRDESPLTYTREKTLVVVWKAHLVSYLHDSLSVLVDDGIPKENCIHVDDWVRKELFRHLYFGDQLQLLEESRDVDRTGLNEEDLQSYLSIRPEKASPEELLKHSYLVGLLNKYESIVGDLHNELIKDYRIDVLGISRNAKRQFGYDAQEVIGVVRGVVNQIPKALRLGVDVTEMEFEELPTDLRRIEEIKEIKRDAINGGEEWITVGLREYEKAEEDNRRIRKQKQRVVARFLGTNQEWNKVSSQYRDAAARLRTKYEKKLTQSLCPVITDKGRVSSKGIYNYLEILRGFYTANEIPGNELRTAIDQEDTLFLLWLIRLITKNLDDQSKRKMTSYSHVLIDEAQFYSPMMLRFFKSIVNLSKGSMTIVGDLEQRLSSDTGMFTWEESGLTAEELKSVVYLETGYRWAESIFDFVSAFKLEHNITAKLSRPDVFYSGKGAMVNICNVRREHILDSVLEAVARYVDDHGYKSLAIVTPYVETDELVKAFETQLKSRAINTQWASGHNLRELVNKVVITDYDSVVGLEFNGVIVVEPDLVLGQPDSGGINAVWVAITRAKRFLNIVSSTSKSSIVEKGSLGGYMKIEENENVVKPGECKENLLSSFVIVEGGFEFRRRVYKTFEGAYHSWKAGAYTSGFEELDGSDASELGEAVEVMEKGKVSLLNLLIKERLAQDPGFASALKSVKSISPGGSISERDLLRDKDYLACLKEAKSEVE